MKFFRLSALIVVLSVALVLPAFADETVTDSPGDSSTETLTAETSVEGSTIVVNVAVPAPETPVPTDVVEETPAASPASDTYSVLELPAAAATDTEGEPPLSQSIVTLFGEYTPRTQTVTHYLADGTSVSYQEYVPGLAGLDYAWLAGVALFSIVLWSLFALIGGVAKRG